MQYGLRFSRGAQSTLLALMAALIISQVYIKTSKAIIMSSIAFPVQYGLCFTRGARSTLLAIMAALIISKIYLSYTCTMYDRLGQQAISL